MQELYENCRAEYKNFLFEKNSKFHINVLIENSITRRITSLGEKEFFLFLKVFLIDSRKI